MIWTLNQKKKPLFQIRSQTLVHSLCGPLVPMRCYLSWVSQLVLNTFQSDPTGFAVTHSLHTISLSQNCIFHSQSIWSCSARGLRWLPLCLWCSYQCVHHISLLLRSSSSFAGIAKTSQLLPSVLDLSWRATWRLWSAWRSIYWTRSLSFHYWLYIWLVLGSDTSHPGRYIRLKRICESYYFCIV